VAERVGSVDTPVSIKAARLRDRGVRVGSPYRGETSATSGGRRTQFNRGWIFWDKGPGAHHIGGAVYRRFRSLGQAAGRLGYPRTDLWDVPDSGAKVQRFQRGRVFRTSRGALAVWGRIDSRYAKAGGSSGRLGLPVRSQYRTRRGWAAGFQHGRITWNTRTGRVRIHTH
jgi:uncharacterized protein with LGFP repeats